ncbi:hypothetical protein [Ktedonobacter sp. SOSP1-52]|uniref:hypothetical protein n=1 Tax=Ktedonobacter sp. SOSP1-52 TaxID=2778366 RepID=UPI001916C95B|nr:hypothetical protein [Ktedonobacter sp. SOSP1-52]
MLCRIAKAPSRQEDGEQCGIDACSIHDGQRVFRRPLRHPPPKIETTYSNDTGPGSFLNRR